MARKPTVYVETTIPSYLTSEPSRDLVTAAYQQITHAWWKTAGEKYTFVTSQPVIDEAAKGDPEIAAKRLTILKDLEILPWNDDVTQLTDFYHRRLGLTGAATRDIIHIAYSVAYNVECLATWNCSHIANMQVIKRLQRLNDSVGRATAMIATPHILAELPAASGDEL